MGTEDTSNIRKNSRVTLSRLKREREQRGWTQSELAERIGTTQVNVSRWEKGITLPGPYYRQRLADIFAKSIEGLGFISQNNEEFDEGITTVSDIPLTPPFPIWNVPQRRNPFFTGREQILAHLYSVFKSSKVTPSIQVQAISGLGGIGKTQIASEYAYRYCNHYQALLWIDASSRDALNTEFMLLAGLLNLPEQQETDQDIMIRAVKRWLSAHSNWLLILDNVDDPEMIISFLPMNMMGDVLITTRLQALGPVAQSIEVEKMELDECVLFLLHRSKILALDTSLDQAMKEHHTQATEIVAMLDGLPLALDQAGAYIEETRCGLSGYLDLYSMRRKELLLRRGRLPLDHPEPVATTWSLSFQRVEQENRSAADLLRLLAFLNPEAIPEELILLDVAEPGLSLASIPDNPLKINEVVELLLRYSLIRRNPEAKSLSMHRLVQVVLKDDMDRETQRLWAERAIRAVSCAFLYVESQIWQLQTWQPQMLEKCQHYLPHVQMCAIFSEEYDLAIPEAAQLFNEAASHLIVHARYKQAEFLLLRAREIRQRVLKVHHSDIARTLNDLGGLYLNWGKYQEAEPCLQEALAIRQQELGKGHLDVAQTCYNLASLYRSQGTYEKAEPFYLQALRIREATLGVNHLLVAQSYYGLAKLYLSQEKYSSAEELCKQALHIREQHFEEKPRMLASTLSVLAKIYVGQEKLDQAEKMNTRALQIREQGSGKDHPHVAVIINSLVEIYHARGKYREAEPLIARSLKIHEEILGPEHPYTAYSLSNKAENFFFQRIYDQAELYYKKALAIRQRHLGIKHPRTASTYFDIARLYFTVGRYEEAELFCYKALSIQKDIFGRDHPTVIRTLEQYTAVQRKRKRESEANDMETNT
jgi:tetratricopeptide (TPR) repeat protein/transcriptional regulator with XRE-family HTH domain